MAVRAALGTALLCPTLLVGASASSAQQGGNGPTSGFVAANGPELVVKGQPWKFAGYNLPCANPFDLSDNQLLYYLNNIQQNSKANVVRLWFFQSQGGPGNWSNFDRVISDIKSVGMRAVVTLTNETSTCDEPSASALYKTIDWYQSGYLSPEGGYSLSFHDYAVAVAAHYAKEPAVAFWQLVNEAQAPSYDSSSNLTCPDELAARDALRSFSDTMVTAIQAVDRNHLIDLGTLSTGECGLGDASDYDYVHAGGVSLCEFHDYGQPSTAMPSALSDIVSGCHALGKPVYIGESGIPANVQPDGTPTSTCEPWPSCSPYQITFQTLNQRATFFGAKIQAANQAGIAGYLIWVKSPFYTDTTDGYAISDGDPTEAELAQALQPYPTGTTTKHSATTLGPAAATPEAPFTASMLAVAALALGGGVWWVRRRSRYTRGEPAAN